MKAAIDLHWIPVSEANSRLSQRAAGRGWGPGESTYCVFVSAPTCAGNKNIKKSSVFFRQMQGPRSKFSSGEAKEECVKVIFLGGGGGGGHACGFLFNFIKVTENAVITIKNIDFFPQLQ